MASVFDLPPQDVLFSCIFSYLEVQDIWVLRLVCTKMYHLCWDYFSDVCNCLSVCLSPGPLPPASMVGLGAGIAILKQSRRVQCVQITAVALSDRSHPGFEELLRAMINSVTALKRLSFFGVDLSGVVLLLHRLSSQCQELVELELCGVELGSTQSAQQMLELLLKHSKRTLMKLSVKDLIFSPFQPLPAEYLSELRYLCINNCHHVSSEGCLEELFRRCPLLEVVDLCDVQTVSNRTLMVMSEYCSHLQRLVLAGCPLVTIEPIGKLKKKGVSLDVHSINSTGLGASKLIPGQI